MDTIGLYIHIHLTEEGRREEEGYLKCLIYKYCVKKKIASIIFNLNIDYAAGLPRLFFWLGDEVC